MNRPFLYVIVPLFNEAENIPRLVKSLRELDAEFQTNMRLKFILVDDGSDDETSTIAGQALHGTNFTVLTHKKNLGPGRAFATAFKYIENKIKSDDWVVTMEGDNTSNHNLVRQMFTRTQEGYDVILASPYMYGGGLSYTTPLRLVLSFGANTFVKEFLGISGILTVSSFFRLYKGTVMRELYRYYGSGIIERSGFESMIEILMKMIFLNVAISEVPMVLDLSRRAGKSKMKVGLTIKGYLTLLRDKRRWFELASNVSG